MTKTNIRRGTHLIPFCLAQSVKDAARLSREDDDAPLPSIEDAVCVAFSGASAGGACPRRRRRRRFAEGVTEIEMR